MMRKKTKYGVIPNICSLLSLVAGFISIILSSNDNFKLVGIFILIGVLMDSIDGRIAQATKSVTEHGKHLDSLSDMVTFGIAPSILIYMRTLYTYRAIGLSVSICLPVCAALRLARFSVKPTKGFFEGMPTTFAGGSIAYIHSFFKYDFSPLMLLVFTIIISLLMVSMFPYYKPRKFKIKDIKYIILLSLIVILSIFFLKWSLLAIMLIYIISGPIIHIGNYLKLFTIPAENNK